jgi:hypothetical protein
MTVTDFATAFHCLNILHGVNGRLEDERGLRVRYALQTSDAGQVALMLVIISVAVRIPLSP